MTDQTRTGRTETPQSVVGPITLGLGRNGNNTIPLQPNSILGPIALGIAQEGAAVILAEVSGTAGGITLTVTCNAQTSTIVITASSATTSVASLTPGSTLYAVARTDTDLIILLADGEAKTFLTFPVGSGTVTAEVTTSPVT